MFIVTEYAALNSNKNAANKIHLSHVNASMARLLNEMCSKMLHNVYISRCHQHRKQLGQG